MEEPEFLSTFCSKKNHPPKLLIHTKIYEKLDYFLKNNKVPHIIFHGSSGTGKKTIVYNFINKIYSNDLVKIKTNVMFVNCAHGKGIKFIRDELKFFAKTNVHLTTSKNLNLRNSSEQSVEKDPFTVACEGKSTEVLKNSSKQSVEKDQTAVACEGKLTFLAEALPKPKINFFECNVEKLPFSPTLRSGENVNNLGVNKNEFFENKVETKFSFSNEKIKKNKETGIFFKTIVLLNADYLTIDAQSALRRCIELFSYNTRFIIIVENKNKLLCPILSRFCEIHVPEHKITNFASTSFPQNSFSSTLRSDESLNSQSTENGSFSTLHFGKNIKYLKNYTLNLHNYNLNLNENLTEYKKKRMKELNFILNDFYEYVFIFSNFSTLHSDKFIFNSGNASTKNVNLPSQATANWSSSTLRSEEFLNNQDNVTIEKYIFTLSTELYNRGFSCLDIINQISGDDEIYGEQSNEVQNIIREKINEEHRLKILMRFYKIKSEYRNEKLLIVYILNMIIYPDVFDEI